MVPEAFYTLETLITTRLRVDNLFLNSWNMGIHLSSYEFDDKISAGVNTMAYLRTHKYGRNHSRRVNIMQIASKSASNGYIVE